MRRLVGLLVLVLALGSCGRSAPQASSGVEPASMEGETLASGGDWSPGYARMSPDGQKIVGIGEDG